MTSSQGRAAPRPDFDVIVVGAGFAGLYAIHRFTQMGLSVRAFERAKDVGGVWQWNRYPGARCDCESYYYSYGFSPELQQEWTWSLRYSEQPEILRYLQHVADRFDLRRHIRFDSGVSAAHYDESAALWRVKTESETLTCRFFITAMGCLSKPNWPDIPGIEAFEGRFFHTAAWPTDGVDFRGRRVGVIGTGASAVQAIPRLAREAERLVVFQRTANWVLPAHNRTTGSASDAAVKASYDQIRAACLASPGAVPFEGATRSAFDVDDVERRATYERLWKTGGMRFFTAFNDLFTSEAANRTAQAFVAEQIRAIVRDPMTAKRLTPDDHPIGVKRPPVDDDYYDTFNRPNVELVDLRITPIERVDRGGVKVRNGTHELDDLVLATGFDALTGSLLAVDVRGRGGASLSDVWAEGPRTYLGLAVAGFPNLFTITGPQSPSVLANMPTAVEQHVDWIADCLSHVARQSEPSIEATEEAQSAWSAHTAEVVSHTLYPRSRSWYFGSNIPNKPRAFGVYVGGFSSYRERCEAIARAGYEGFRLGAASVETGAS